MGVSCKNFSSASHPIFPLSMLIEYKNIINVPPHLVGICGICQTCLWPLKTIASKRKRKKKKREKEWEKKKYNTLPLPPLIPSPYSGATWNCLKRWAVIKYCRADIMTGKIKERKQKKGQTNSRPIMPPPTPRLSPPRLIKDTRPQIGYWSATTLLLWSSVLSMLRQSPTISQNNTTLLFLMSLETICIP